MFCSGCGAELDAGLNFCKRCGKGVVGDLSKIGLNLTNALGAIGVFGFLGFAAVLYLLLRSPTIAQGTIMPVALIYLATLLGVLFLILRQTAFFTDGRQGRSRPDEAPAYLKPAGTQRLGEPSEISIGVTEHTTKELDPVPARRK